MTITTSWQGQILIACLHGELSMKNHQALSEELDELVQADAAGLVLDFADVIYLASVGIGMLLNLAKSGHQRDLPVRLAAPRPDVRTVLEIVGADATVPIDSTVARSIEVLTAVPV